MGMLGRSIAAMAVVAVVHVQQHGCDAYEQNGPPVYYQGVCGFVWVGACAR